MSIRIFGKKYISRPLQGTSSDLELIEVGDVIMHL